MESCLLSLGPLTLSLETRNSVTKQYTVDYVKVSLSWFAKKEKLCTAAAALLCVNLFSRHMMSYIMLQVFYRCRQAERKEKDRKTDRHNDKLR